MSTTDSPTAVYNPTAHDALSAKSLNTGSRVPPEGIPEFANWPDPWPTGAELRRHTGGCHCGRFKFELAHPKFGEEAEAGEVSLPVVQCNCSVCAIHGKMNIYVPGSARYFRFLGQDGAFPADPSAAFSDPDLGAHAFNKNIIIHRFCKSCGTNFLGHPSEVLAQQMNVMAVNVRALDGFDLKKIVNLKELDGKSS